MYFILPIMLVAQFTVNKNPIVGQALYLVGNLLFLCRDFKLERPTPDKVKNVLFSSISGVCLGLALMG